MHLPWSNLLSIHFDWRIGFRCSGMSNGAFWGNSYCPCIKKIAGKLGWDLLMDMKAVRMMIELQLGLPVFGLVILDRRSSLHWKTRNIMRQEGVVRYLFWKWKILRWRMLTRIAGLSECWSWKLKGTSKEDRCFLIKTTCNRIFIYFAFACNLFATQCVETHLFEDFAERARRHLNGLTKSNVSQLWSTCFEALFKQFGEIAEQVNLNLKSHHGKSGSNQKLTENPSTAGLPQVFHSGSDVRSSHTLFEHVVRSESMKWQTGKVLSNWSSSAEMGIVRGEPPNIHDIRGEENLRQAIKVRFHLWFNPRIRVMSRVLDLEVLCIPKEKTCTTLKATGLLSCL